MVYAQRTEVSPEKTRAEIERTLMKYGASAFMFAVAPGRAMVTFESSNRRIRFSITLPKIDAGMQVGQKKRLDQAVRSRWRGLFLCIKAKCESVEAGIESFEEAFLAHVVLPDGGTVYEHSRERIAIAYQGGEIPPLLPGPKP